MKKINKKSSENDQSTGHFQSFFIYFFRPPDPRSEKKIPVNQLIKKIWPKCLGHWHFSLLMIRFPVCMCIIRNFSLLHLLIFFCFSFLENTKMYIIQRIIHGVSMLWKICHSGWHTSLSMCIQPSLCARFFISKEHNVLFSIYASKWSFITSSDSFWRSIEIAI